jgi:sugar lactone lactonase YvrE
VKRLLLMLALGLGGCGQSEQARVLLLDPAWTAEVAATMDAGFVAPDGLHWADGNLWLADEAGSAVRRWRPGAPTQTLLQDVGGRSSPEDIVRDAAGNLYVTAPTKACPRPRAWRSAPTARSISATARPTGSWRSAPTDA